MKKITYSIATLLALCACTKEISYEDQEFAQDADMTFCASLNDDENLTRASIGENNSIVWDEHDSIAVFNVNTTDGATNSKCLLISGAGSTSAIFSGKVVKSSVGYFAVYPYRSTFINYNCASADHPKGVLTLSNIDYSTQYAREGNIPSNIPMIAYADAPSEDGATIGLDFKNVFAYLKFQIDYKCKSVTIVPNKVTESLTPSFYSIDFDENDLPETSVTLNGYRTVTLEDKDGGVLEPGTYYVAVLPQTLTEGFSMTFTSYIDETKTSSVSTEKSVTLKRSTVLNLGNVDQSQIIGLQGSGTEETPYLIYDFNDLEAMSYLVNNNVSNYAKAYYKQMKDIDCEGETLTPIGGSNRFSGYYDGFGRSISNLSLGTITFDGLNSSALFGCIKDASIYRVNVINPIFNSPTTAKSYNVSPIVGVAISENKGNIISICHSSSNSDFVLSNPRYVDYGGIVAFNESNIKISYCTSDVNVKIYGSTTTSDDHIYAGGILGYTSGEKTSDPTHDEAENDAITSVRYCRSYGNITLHDSNCYTCIGGIIGICYDSLSGDVCTRMGYCVNYGSFEFYGTSNCVLRAGGIAACMDSDGYMEGLFTEVNPVVTCCLNRGQKLVTDNKENQIGGIAGYVFDSDTHFSYCVNMMWRSFVNSSSDHYVVNDSSFIYVENATASTDTFAHKCFSTYEWSTDAYCEIKKNLTCEDMNDLCGDEVTWSGKASDGSLDLEF